MGKDKRLWRKLVKKLHRKKKRQLKAQAEQSKCSNFGDTESYTSPNSSDTDDVDETFFLPQEEWERRQNEAEIVSKMKQIEAEWLAKIEAEQKVIVTDMKCK